MIENTLNGKRIAGEGRMNGIQSEHDQFQASRGNDEFLAFTSDLIPRGRPARARKTRPETIKRSGQRKPPSNLPPYNSKQAISPLSPKYGQHLRSRQRSSIYHPKKTPGDPRRPFDRGALL
jgi:hypothetical protein